MLVSCKLCTYTATSRKNQLGQATTTLKIPSGFASRKVAVSTTSSSSTRGMLITLHESQWKVSGGPTRNGWNKLVRVIAPPRIGTLSYKDSKWERLEICSQSNQAIQVTSVETPCHTSYIWQQERCRHHRRQQVLEFLLQKWPVGYLHSSGQSQIPMEEHVFQRLEETKQNLSPDFTAYCKFHDPLISYLLWHSMDKMSISPNWNEVSCPKEGHCNSQCLNGTTVYTEVNLGGINEIHDNACHSQRRRRGKTSLYLHDHDLRNKRAIDTHWTGHASSLLKPQKRCERSLRIPA